MGEVSSRLIVSLLDRVTAPAKAVTSSIRSIGDAARGLQSATGIAAFTRGVDAALERSRVRLAAYRAGILEVTASAYVLANALKAPTKAATDWETRLLDIGQKSGIAKDQQIALGEQIRALARPLAQLPTALAGGVDSLVGRGLDPARAMELIAPIGKAATAYRAEIEDLSKAGYAALDNLKVPAKDFMLALDAMARAGKEGAFEIKDMAKEFPALTAAAQSLGMSGVKGVADLAAALEVATKGAADGSQAANNMANFLQKITMKETIKNFQKFGVDVPKELKKAAKEGISPIEHFLKIMDKLTKGGDDVTKLTAIFGDAQVLNFMKPMLANMELYREIRKKALEARGEVEKDFAERMKTAAAAQMQFAAAMENASISIGNALLPAVTAVVNRLDEFVQRVDAFARANGTLVRNTALAVAGLVAFRTAVFAAGFAVTSLQIAALMATAGLARIAQAATFAAAVGLVPLRAAVASLIGVMQIMALRFRMGAAALAAGGGIAAFAAGAFATLTRAALGVVGIFARLAGSVLLFSGAGVVVAAVVAAIGGAFVWLWNNISGIGTFLASFGSAFVAALGPAKGLIEPVVDAAGRLYDKVASWLGPIDASGKKWAEWGKAAGEAVAGWVNAASALAGSAIDAIAAIPGRAVAFAREMYDAGAALAASLWDGMKSNAGAAAAWISETASAMATKATALVSSTVEVLASLPAKVAALASQMYEAGAALITALWDGLKAQIDAMINWFSAKISELSARASALAHSMSFGLVGSAPPTPAAPSSPGGASPGQARALGGNVDAGRSYWVGEKGREIFTPGRSGTITPTGATGGVTVGSVTINAPMNFHGTENAQEVARTVRDTLQSEVRETLRSVFADAGVRFA